MGILADALVSLLRCGGVMNTIPDWMILNSFRYALGRSTYQVEKTTRWLIENWESVPEGTQELIESELEKEFKRDARSRQLGGRAHPLGADTDRAEWLRLLCEITNKREDKED